jgi:hypothetical protein
MADRDVIDALIATYRELNLTLRPKLAQREVWGDPIREPESLAGILYRLRNRELNASQAIKEMIRTGETAIPDDEQEAMVALHETALGLAPNVLLSQFGTAREATLAMVRDLPDEVWQQEFNTPRGRMTLRRYLETLVERDRAVLQTIQTKIGSQAPAS